MGAIVEAVGAPEFLAGLRWGAITGAVALLVGIAWRRRQASLAAIAGLALATAISLAMPVARSVPLALLLGLGLLVMAGLIANREGGGPYGIALAAPGAYVVAFRSGIPGDRWVPWLIFAVIAVGTATGAAFDRRYRSTGLSALFLGGTVAGAFLTLPDTEEILVIVGAALPVLLLVWPRSLVAMGSGLLAVLGILMWTIAWGGRGRESSIIGASACLGVLLIEPLVGRGRNLIDARVLFLVHTGIVLVAARVAGLEDDPITAALIATAALGAGILACWLLGGKEREYVADRMDGPGVVP